MKKVIRPFLFVLFACFAIYSIGQTGASKESLLIKEWKIVSVEEFGVENPATEKQASDYARFSADKKCEIKHEGLKPRTGTWSMDKAATTLNVAFDDDGEKRVYKIYALSETNLSIEYKDKVLIKTKYNYIPKP